MRQPYFPNGNKPQFYIFAVLDIIKVGLYLLSRLQIPSWLIVVWLSQSYEKGIFYGCRSRKGRHLFILVEYGRQKRAPLGNDVRFLIGVFCF